MNGVIFTMYLLRVRVVSSPGDRQSGQVGLDEAKRAQVFRHFLENQWRGIKKLETETGGLATFC